MTCRDKVDDTAALGGVGVTMAKKKGSVVLRLVSQAGTGFFYTIRKAIRPNTEPCALFSLCHILLSSLLSRTRGVEWQVAAD